MSDVSVVSLVRPKPKPVRKPKDRTKSVKKVSSRGYLTLKAHALLREIVLERDKGCVCPPPAKGHSDVRQAGHLIKSTKGAIRFDLYNISEQCSACNGRHVHFEHYYVQWFIDKFGAEEYLRLCKASDGLGLKNYELEELIVQLKLIREKQIEDKEFHPYYTQAEILSGGWANK